MKVGLLVLTILFCSYKEYEYFGVYEDDVQKVKQTFDDWCLYAVAEMTGSGSQCDHASNYIEWKNEQEQIIDPTMSDCCQWGVLCDGVSFKNVIPFWNYATYDN